MENPADNEKEKDIYSCELSVVLPCLNEEGTVSFCIKQALEAMEKEGVNGEVLISDNGSNDRSVQLASKAGARVVHTERKGYGSALLNGISQANGRYIIMADCDATYDLSKIAPFLNKLRQGSDMVMGSRINGEILAGAMPFLHRYIGNPILTGCLNFLFKTKVSDAHCGLRGFSREAFNTMELKSTSMAFASEMVIKAGTKGLKIDEVPITLHPDQEGRVPHLSTFRDGWRHLRLMLLYSPVSVFLVPGSALLFLGLLFLLVPSFGRIYIGPIGMDIHSMVLGAIITLLGLHTITLGIYAQTYAQIEQYQEKSSFMARLEQLFSLERALVLGSLMVFIGVAFFSIVIVQWLSHDLKLEGNLQIRPAVWGLVFLTSGCQIIFSAMFLSMLQHSRDS